MSNDGPNPYAPPLESTSAEPREILLEMLREQGPIRFRGSITNQSIDAYLRAYEHVGCLSMAATAIVLIFISLVITMIAGNAAFFVALGIVGLFGMMLVTSTLPYRRSVFINANPQWDAYTEGEIAMDGVRIKQDDGESFYRWEWFEKAVVGRQVLVLVPALHPNHPIIVSASMLTKPADADRVPALARDLAAAIQGTSETRRYNNRSVLRSSKRERSRGVTDGGIPFEGQVTSEDLSVLPEKILHQHRPVRAYLLIGGLLVFPCLLLIGVGQISGLRMIMVSFIGIAVVSLVLRIVMRRRRSSDVGGQTVFYLTAFADDSGITSDFAVTVTTVPWQSLQQAYADEKRIAFSRGTMRQVIIARSDMFDSDHSWQQFRALVTRKLT